MSSLGEENLLVSVQTVTDHLNQLGGKRYRYDDNIMFSYVSKLLSEGYTLDDLLFVVDNKCKQWAKIPDKSNWLRPQTLFGQNFTSYLNETKKENYEYPAQSENRGYSNNQSQKRGMGSNSGVGNDSQEVKEFMDFLVKQEEMGSGGY